MNIPPVPFNNHICGLRSVLPKLVLCAGMSICLCSQPVNAQEAAEAVPQTPSDPFTITVEALSDYRFRGHSYSGGDPTVAVTAAAEFGPTICGYMIATSVEFSGNDGMEFGTAIGWTGTLSAASSDTTLGLEARAFGYDGFSQEDYAELSGSITQQFGTVSAGLELAVVPIAQDRNYRGTAYAGSRFTWKPGDGPAILFAKLGAEKQPTTSADLDWALGVRTDFGSRFSVAISYVDTTSDLPQARDDATIVFSLSAGL